MVIDYCSSRLLIPRGSIVLSFWMKCALHALLKESRSLLSFSIGISNIWETE